MNTLLNQMSETSRTLEQSEPRTGTRLRKSGLDFDPGKALKMLNIIGCATSRPTSHGGRLWESIHSFDPATPKERPFTEAERQYRLQLAADLRQIADWLDTTCKREETDES